MDPRHTIVLLTALALVSCAEPNMNTNTDAEPPKDAAPGMTVSILAHDGTYVGCELGATEGGQGVLRSGKAIVGDWERFTLFRKGGDTIALQAANGKYVCADGDHREVLVANRDYIGAWESFVLAPQDSDRVAFKTHRGLYVATDHALPGDESNRLMGDRSGVGAWERFTIVPDTAFKP